MTQFDPSQIPSLASLADQYVVADRMFSQTKSASWVAHLELVSATNDGFSGGIPSEVKGVRPGPGWGCDSNKVAWWKSPDGVASKQPSCVPDYDLSLANGGAFEPTSVANVPTIMDRLDAAGLTWKLYAQPPGGAYGWAICPTFAECLDTPQHANQVSTDQVITDANNGTLPNFSVVLPDAARSQHNGESMMQGDDWIAQVVNAIGEGPEWDLTAVFILYDDCGCFYDHVPPPPGEGPRVPMVIVGPYAKAAYTDSNTASFPSLLAYVESVFGLSSLGTADASAYGFDQAFDYSQPPRAYVPLTVHPVPPSSLRYIRQHPAKPDIT